MGGGVGWLHRKLGLGCDNLIAADMFTADGEVLTVSEKAHSDLYWAIRGGEVSGGSQQPGTGSGGGGCVIVFLSGIFFLVWLFGIKF